jgi:UDP:flavonoid glycosyltransferase YjiC (YdhE family)
VRVLFSSISGVGHVYPMVPLARALMARGHEVKWAAASEMAPLLAGSGIRAERAGIALGAAMAEYRRRYPDSAHLPPADIPDHMGPKLFGEIAAPPMLDDLVPLARAFEPDLLVHDAGEFAAPIVGAMLGVPAVTVAFGALLPARRVAGAGEEASRLWLARGLEPRPFGGSYDTLYLDIYPASLQAPTSQTIPTQPLRPYSIGDGPDDGAFDMGGDPDRPLVYLTFGTVFRNEHLLRSAVDAIVSLDVRLLVTVGPAADPAALGALPVNVRVERFVSQARVLGACAVVASHAGSGTFLAALAHGIPQLCLPQGADQFLNAAAAARSGAGITLEPGEATGHAIADAVDRLLAEEAYRRHAQRLGSEIAAMPSPDDVAGVLERLVDGAAPPPVAG